MGTSYSDHDAWTVPPSWVPLIHDLPQRCESEIGLHCLADSWNLMTGYGDFFLTNIFDFWLAVTKNMFEVFLHKQLDMFGIC